MQVLSSHSVNFRAGSPVSAPMTWGQLNIWRPLLAFDDTTSFNLLRTTALEPDVTTERFLDAVRTLIERHTTLRTRFLDERQEIAGTGEVPVVFWAWPEFEGEFDFHAEAAILAAGSFDLTSDWPVRIAGLLGPDGAVAAAALVISHVAADGWTADRLLDDLRALLAGEPAPERAEPRWEPLDQLAFERSEAGRRAGAATIEHWAGILRTAPASMYDFTPLPVEGPLIARYRFDSAALATAASILGARVGTSPSTVVLTLASLWLANHCGKDQAIIELVAGNRITPRLRALRTHLAQDALFTVDTRDTDLTTALRAAHHAAIRAYCRAMYNPPDLGAAIDGISTERGLCFDRATNFNDVHPNGVTVPRAAEATSAELAAMRELSTLTHLEPMAWNDKKLFMTFEQSAERCSLTMLVDSRYLPPTVIERFLWGIERVCCAALSEELSGADVTRLVGVPPVERGPEWVRTRAGWVRPEAVQRLVERVAPGARVLVAPAPLAGGDGLVELRAQVSDVDVAALHRAVVAALTGEIGVVAPESYDLRTD